MDKREFVEIYIELLNKVDQNNKNEKAWIELALHIDGTDLNYEESLVSIEELEQIDSKKAIPWEKEIWEHVLELFPNNITAHEKLCDLYLDILDDPEMTIPVVDSLLKLEPDNCIGLHSQIVLASIEENDDLVKNYLYEFCKINPKCAISLGSLDFTDDYDFLAPLAKDLIQTIDEMPTHNNNSHRYNQSLRETLAKIKNINF